MNSWTLDFGLRSSVLGLAYTRDTKGQKPKAKGLMINEVSLEIVLVLNVLVKQFNFVALLANFDSKQVAH
jgi:hypothetical protein